VGACSLGGAITIAACASIQNGLAAGLVVGGLGGAAIGALAGLVASLPVGLYIYSKNDMDKPEKIFEKNMGDMINHPYIEYAKKAFLKGLN